MTVIPGTPGTYMDLQKRKNRGEIQRDVNRGFSRKRFYDSLVCAIFTYIYLYSRGQILRTSFGKNQPSQRGCSKYHLEHQKKNT